MTARRHHREYVTLRMNLLTNNPLKRVASPPNWLPSILYWIFYLGVGDFFYLFLRIQLFNLQQFPGKKKVKFLQFTNICTRRVPHYRSLRGWVPGHWEEQRRQNTQRERQCQKQPHCAVQVSPASLCGSAPAPRSNLFQFSTDLLGRGKVFSTSY